MGVRVPTIVFRFDEVVNERSSPSAGAAGGGMGGGVGGGFSGGFGGGGTGGQATLAQMFAISPSDGRERVRWRREIIEIAPRDGLRPNTTYQITLRPGLSDLTGNARKEAHTLRFSTGPALATGEVRGVLFDWVGGKPAVGARLEAFAPADTSFRWRTQTDSVGRFVLPSLAPSRYLLRGWIDQNQNGQIDGREAFDSLTIALDDTATRTLYAFEHDTIGPRLESVELVDTTGIRLKFDRAPATDWRPVETTVTLQRQDSSQVPLGRAMPSAEFDSLRAARRAAEDSAASGDSSAVAAPSVGRDTTPTLPVPTIDLPVPILSWVFPLEQPLAPGPYRLKVRQVRGLTGRLRDSEREIRVRPPAPKDSTSAGPRRP